jgi:KUP system potassium uptake protein
MAQTDIAAAPPREESGRTLFLAALGIVYGDIGTSPLYALKQCFTGGLEPSRPHVLGALSLITWALILVVTVKYVLVIMRADNKGEGGILALTALAHRNFNAGWVVTVGLVGAALFYGDAIITPAISVLSAVEGLTVATPLLEPYVVPGALLLLVALFLVQRRGTAAVGGWFGPVMLAWFAVLAALGLGGILRNPEVLRALDPLEGAALLFADPARGFVLMGAVVLAVTGGEALYTDMGHFGRPPIKRAWLQLVLPALLLNYYGQGALILVAPAAVENPFYLLAPGWALYPLVGLAAASTVIASQAVISGAFSITRQAVQLGYIPRFRILHTSAEEIGQIYVPFVNLALLVAVVLLVIGFGSSDRLGAAYGIAVTGTMTCTTILAYLVMQGRGWPVATAALVFGFFLFIDLLFFSANLLKVVEGGWVPLLVAGAVYLVMSTWRRGRALLGAERAENALAITSFIRRLGSDRATRVPGTAVFMTGNPNVVPGHLLHNIKHNRVLHERNVLLTVHTEDVPRVLPGEQLEVTDLGKGFFAVIVRYGFMQEPNIVRALARARVEGLRFELAETSFFVGREKLIARRRGRANMPLSQKRLFIFLSGNMLDATEFFRIPPNRAVELGAQLDF